VSGQCFRAIHEEELVSLCISVLLYYMTIHRLFRLSSTNSEITEYTSCAVQQSALLTVDTCSTFSKH